MTMREHLRDAHETMAAHHIAMAKTHRQIAKHFAKSEMAEGSEDLASSHEELAGHHTSQAEYHVECCKTLDGMGKAMGMGMDRDELMPMPDGVSAIIPDAPQHLRAIPRGGQRDLGEMAKVDPAFEALVKIE